MFKDNRNGPFPNVVPLHFRKFVNSFFARKTPVFFVCISFITTFAVRNEHFVIYLKKHEVEKRIHRAY